jgi:serine/threonine protein kinase
MTPEFVGEYKVIQELGRGATGVVYLCQHPTLARQLAVKVMAAQVSEQPGFLERFRREGEVASQLRHPNIVQVYDFACRDGVFYIAMEYLGARTLRSLIAESGPRPVEESCRLVGQLLDALEHAHSHGVIHRDIKPANIMLTDRNEVALTDFSIAQGAGSAKLTQTGTALGTPEYMAPEQFDGKSDVRSDLYAAAIVLYELLTGFSPFRADSLVEVMKKQIMLEPEPLSSVDFTIPESLSQFVARALSKDPEGRPASAAEMKMELQRALLAKEVVAKPAPPVPVAPAAQPSSPKGWGAPLVGFLLFGMLLVVVGRYSAKSTPPVVPTPGFSPSAPTQTTPSAQLVSATRTSTPMPASPLAQSKPQIGATPEPSDSPTNTPEFPSQATFRPGDGLGPLRLGDTQEQVEYFWGPPYEGRDIESEVVWDYGGKDRPVTLHFDKVDLRLTRIDINQQGYSLENASEVALGASQETVLKHLPEPSLQDNGRLNYEALGVFFEFNTRSSRTLPRFGEHNCESILIYPAGQSPIK